MGKDSSGSLSSFICYNCNEKNFFDKTAYANKNEGDASSEMKQSEIKVKVVSIECKSCREINTVKIEY
jgi:GH24 family phage-related lysozyme (muramidase)